MAANPFTIDIGNPLAGFGQLAQQYHQRSYDEEQKAKQLEAQKAKQQEVKGVLDRGDIGEMAQYMAANPQMAPGLEKAFGFKSEQTKQNMIDSSLRIIGGEDPYEVIRDRAAIVSQQGGDPSQTLAALNKTPEEIIQSSKVLLAGLAPDKAKAVQQAMQQKKSEFAQGTGSMSGYVFDKEAGTFSIDPIIKQDLEAKAAEKAAEGTKLDAKGRQGINKDVTALIGDTVKISQAASSMAKLKASSSPASQLAAIFKFMKALDPTSVVREGEQQMARSTGGPADYLVGMISQIRGEGSLPPEVFSDMVQTSQDLADSAINASTGQVDSYLDTYEDTIPGTFKSALIRRLPKSSGRSKASEVELSPSAMKYLGGQ